MTWTSAAKLVLLCLALVTLAGAETMWSLALSNVPDGEAPWEAPPAVAGP